MTMPTYYVLADLGFGMQTGAKRMIVGYSDGAEVPETVQKNGTRLTERQFRDLYRHLYGADADTYIQALKGMED